MQQTLLHLNTVAKLGAALSELIMLKENEIQRLETQYGSGNAKWAMERAKVELYKQAREELALAARETPLTDIQREVDNAQRYFGDLDSLVPVKGRTRDHIEDMKIILDGVFTNLKGYTGLDEDHFEVEHV